MLGGDGKAAQTCTGLLGAYCTCCKCNKKQGSDPNVAENGYEKDRSRDQNLELYATIRNEDGSINLRIRDRFGMTIGPIGTFLDWTGTVKHSHATFYLINGYENIVNVN